MSAAESLKRARLKRAIGPPFPSGRQEHRPPCRILRTSLQQLAHVAREDGHGLVGASAGARLRPWTGLEVSCNQVGVGETCSKSCRETLISVRNRWWFNYVVVSAALLVASCKGASFPAKDLGTLT